MYKKEKICFRSPVVKNRDFWTMPSISDDRVDCRVHNRALSWRRKNRVNPENGFSEYLSCFTPTYFLLAFREKHKKKCIIVSNYFLATEKSFHARNPAAIFRWPLRNLNYARASPSALFVQKLSTFDIHSKCWVRSILKPLWSLEVRRRNGFRTRPTANSLWSSAGEQFHR